MLNVHKITSALKWLLNDHDKNAEMKLAADSGVRQTAEKAISYYHVDEDDFDETVKFSEQVEHVVVVLSRHDWGKGRTLHEALNNIPHQSHTEPLVIQVVTIPAGTSYFPDRDQEGVYNRVYVDGMGSTHYPVGSAFFTLNDVDKEKNLFRLIPKSAG